MKKNLFNLAFILLTLSFGNAVKSQDYPASNKEVLPPSAEAQETAEEIDPVKVSETPQEDPASLQEDQVPTRNADKFVKLKNPKEFLPANHPFLTALTQAYNTNPDLRASVKNQYSINENVNVALSGGRPNFSLSTQTGRAWTQSESARPDTRVTNQQLTTPTTASATVTQPLYKGGGVVAGTEQAENQVKAGFETFRSKEQSTLFSAAQSYLDLWYKLAVLELKKTSENVLMKEFKQAEARAEVGELTLTDVSQAKAQYAQAIADRISAEQDVRTAEVAYENVIGEKPTNLDPPPPIENLFDLPKTRDEFVEVVTKSNPDVIAALHSERAAFNNIDVKKSSILPNVNLQGNASRQLQSSSKDSRANSASAIVSLSIPIFQGGAEWASLRQSYLGAAQQKLTAKKTLNDAVTNAVAAWESWAASKERIKQLVIQVKAAELSLQGARQESLVGERTLLDVLTTERNLVQAQTDLAKAQQAYLIAGYSLLLSLGKLTAVDLKLPVELYDVKGHYNRVRDTWFGFEGISQR
jgi:outer membrane protein